MYVHFSQIFGVDISIGSRCLMLHSLMKGMLEPSLITFSSVSHSGSTTPMWPNFVDIPILLSTPPPPHLQILKYAPHSN